MFRAEIDCVVHVVRFTPISNAVVEKQVVLVVRRMVTDRFVSYGAITTSAVGIALCERNLITKRQPNITQLRLKLQGFSRVLSEVSREVKEVDAELGRFEKEATTDQVDALRRENQELKSKLERIEKLLRIRSS